MSQTFIHYGCHIIIPLIVAIIWYRSKWKKAFLIMLAAFVIDLDHFLATPIFDPNRCSIGFHPLHSLFPILIYLFALYPKKTRLVALGLIIHIFSDCVDCIYM